MNTIKRTLWLAILMAAMFSLAFAAQDWDASPSRKYLNPGYRQQIPQYELSRADSAHGFDVQKYEITLNINDATHFITGNVLATVIAESNLSSIAYELKGLTVSSVLVNGTAATYTHSNGVLNITTNIPSGQSFSTQVFYSGTPQLSNDVYHIGMIFGTNTVFTISDPDAGRMWWPCYDHPWDKAIVDLHITMRSDWKVAANGIRSEIVNNGNGSSTTHWLGQNPMTTYLVCITAGPYVEINQSVPEQNNLPVQNFVMQSQYNNALSDLQRVPQMIAYFSQLFGDYPFEKYGNATVNMSTYGAMEHQTMTTLGNYIINGTGSYEPTIAHELAHQWFGDAVSFLTFKDVWLSEGFATYSEQLWTNYRFGWQAACDYVATSFHQYYMNWENSAGPQTIYNPSFNNYFAPPSYEKAASVLHMLRLKMGDDTFFQFLQMWFDTHKNGNVITAEFQDLAEQASGQVLDQFFNQWIYGSGIPSVEFSVWRIEDISRLKIVAKTTSPTATSFHVDVPLLLSHGAQADSLLITASPQGSATNLLFGGDQNPLVITPNYNNWTLLKQITELKPVLSECLPSNNSVLLSWPVFSAADGGYFIYRKVNGSTVWTQVNNTACHELSYIDTTVSNGITYQYALVVKDTEGYFSVKSAPLTATPQAFSFANNLLLVDETRDGTGANINPNDAMVDEFYQTVLSGLPQSYDTWDCATQGLPELADLGAYKLVLWHADDFSQNLLQDNLADLGGYILGGGKVVLSGWKTALVLSPSFLDRFAGDINLYYDNSASLISATAAGEYSWANLEVDPLKTTGNWNGMLPYIHTFEGAQNSLYTANMSTGSNGNGRSIAFRHDNNGSLVLFGLPLYYMQTSGVQAMLQSLLPWLNPALPVQDGQIPAAVASLNAYPNPFNPSATISYYLPAAGKLSLNLYNLKGQKVRSLLAADKAAGIHSLEFDGKDDAGRSLASGVYFIRMSHPQGELRKAVTLVK